MDQVRLREAEIRARNTDALFEQLRAHLRQYDVDQSKLPWDELRPKATEILVEAQALVEEYQSIHVHVFPLRFPHEELAMRERRVTVLDHVLKGLRIVQPLIPTMTKIIEDGDLTSSSDRPSSHQSE